VTANGQGVDAPPARLEETLENPVSDKKKISTYGLPIETFFPEVEKEGGEKQRKAPWWVLSILSLVALVPSVLASVAMVMSAMPAKTEVTFPEGITPQDLVSSMEKVTAVLEIHINEDGHDWAVEHIADMERDVSKVTSDISSIEDDVSSIEVQFARTDERINLVLQRLDTLLRRTPNGTD